MSPSSLSLSDSCPSDPPDAASGLRITWRVQIRGVTPRTRYLWVLLLATPSCLHIYLGGLPPDLPPRVRLVLPFSWSVFSIHDSYLGVVWGPFWPPSPPQHGPDGHALVASGGLSRTITCYRGRRQENKKCSYLYLYTHLLEWTNRQLLSVCGCHKPLCLLLAWSDSLRAM